MCKKSPGIFHLCITAGRPGQSCTGPSCRHTRTVVRCFSLLSVRYNLTWRFLTLIIFSWLLHNKSRMLVKCQTCDPWGPRLSWYWRWVGGAAGYESRCHLSGNFHLAAPAPTAPCLSHPWPTHASWSKLSHIGGGSVVSLSQYQARNNVNWPIIDQHYHTACHRHDPIILLSICLNILSSMFSVSSLVRQALFWSLIGWQEAALPCMAPCASTQATHASSGIFHLAVMEWELM